MDFTLLPKSVVSTDYKTNIRIDTRCGVNLCILPCCLGAGHEQQKMRPLITWPYNSLMQKITVVLCDLNYNDLILGFGNCYLLYKPLKLQVKFGCV